MSKKRIKGAPGVLDIVSGTPEDVGSDAALADLQAGAVKEEQAYQNSSFGSKAMAGFRTSGLTSLLVNSLARPDFEDEPGYQAPPELLQGLTTDEIAQAREARSERELHYELSMMAYARDDNAELARSGAAVAFGASLVAGFPEGVLTGKLFGLPFQAAARANNLKRVASGLDAMPRTLVSSAVENVTGNLVSTGLEDAFSHRVSAADYVMGAAFGGLATGLEVPHILGARHAAAEKARVRADIQAAVEYKERFNAQAMENLGPNADPRAVAAEATKLETQDLLATQRAALAPLGDDRKLLPDVEKYHAEEQAKELASEGTGELAADMRPARAEYAEIPGGKYLRSASLAENTLDALRADAVTAKTRDGLHKLTGETDNAGVVRRIEEVTASPDRVTAPRAPQWRHVSDALTRLSDKFLPPDHRIMLVDRTTDAKARGQIVSVGKVHIIGIRDGLTEAEAMRTATHEFGHSLFHTYAANAPRETVEGMVNYWRDLTARMEAGDPSAVSERFAGSRLADQSHPKAVDDYTRNINELSAEQFVRHIEADIASGANTFNLPRAAMDAFKRLIQKVADLFGMAKTEKMLDPDDSFVQFFTDILEGRARSVDGLPAKGAELAGIENQKAPRPAPDVSFLQDPIAVKYGLDRSPVDTPLRRAEARAMIELYKKADDPHAVWNNIDQKRLDNLLAKTPSLGSTGLQLLRSENPVARMIASELLETTTGAGGRKSTASLAKYLQHHKQMGNVINEFQEAYKVYRNAAGGGVVEDHFGGKVWERYNRAVAEEIEARRTDPSGAEREVNPAVKAGADALQNAFERMRTAQVDTKTTGWAALPETSVGYMPHKMSPEKLRNLSNEQAGALHSALVDQFVSIEGWDFSFSANLASKYMERIRKRGLGGYASDMGRHSPGAADIVEDALNAMGMAPDEVRANMQRYMRGAPGHTKKRIQLDMLREYGDEGAQFRMIDLFDTDMLGLVRSQSERVSGEVALARHGIMGRAGLKMVRQAMEFGDNGQKTKLTEFDAFDQVSAEFLGEPFGNHGGKWMNRAMQLNSLVRLGGMGFTQAAETINAAVHLGMGRALSMIGSFARLRAEAAKLGRGEKVEGSILESIEAHGGTEFGTDAYKMVFPFDNPQMQYQVHGADTATAADRLLRGGSHAQGKLSFWRAIHGAQQRGVAEQTVLKSLRYIRDGIEDTALADMGITAQVRDAIKAELPNIAEFDAAGRVVKFDITKMEDKAMAEAYVQAIHRGVGQIIQGTFIGETGKWAHEGFLKLLTQFRTFSLTSVEKQWARNRANYGLAQSVGILMGSMAAATPFYLARTYLTAMGRPDKDEYLKKKLDPWVMAKATMNYVSMSGLAPDFIDAMAGIAGYSTTGGRIGTGSEFVGSVVAPAAGLLDDMYKAVQNTREGTDLHGAVENLPLAKLPYLQPVINLVGR